MPFLSVQIPSAAVQTLTSLEPLARFEPRTTFNKRVGQAEEGKRLVALYIADKFASDGGSSFVTDGSSTFYVGLAIALRSAHFKHPFTLVTNNLAITTELDARSTPEHLNVEILGGQIDYALNATFPVEMERIKHLIQNVRLVVVSVRALFYIDGPTSPDLKSLLLKREALQINAPIVVATDWEKLSLAQAPLANKILNRSQWDRLLKDRNQEIWIVCNKPAGFDDDTELKGSLLNERLDPVRHPAQWGEAKDEERYWWQAYKFSEHDNVHFIEVSVG